MQPGILVLTNGKAYGSSALYPGNHIVDPCRKQVVQVVILFASHLSSCPLLNNVLMSAEAIESHADLECNDAQLRNTQCAASLSLHSR